MWVLNFQQFNWQNLLFVLMTKCNYYIVDTISLNYYKEKMGFCPFYLKNSVKCPMSKTNQRNAIVLKLYFLKIEFQFKTQFLDNQVIKNRKLKYIYIYILELEFHELEFFTWYSSSGNLSSKKKNSKSTFAITRCSKNQVLHLKLDFLKIKFQM